MQTVTTLVYEERLSSARTERVFLALTMVSLIALLILFRIDSAAIWTVMTSLVFSYFLFCSINYRILHIQLTDRSLLLRFGLISWSIELANIDSCTFDDTSLWRIGGAGVHFSPIRGRYRAMFNFLEHPRILIGLRVKKGLVRDVAVSTRNPSELKNLLLDRMRDVA